MTESIFDVIPDNVSTLVDDIFSALEYGIDPDPDFYPYTYFYTEDSL